MHRITIILTQYIKIHSAATVEGGNMHTVSHDNSVNIETVQAHTLPDLSPILFAANALRTAIDTKSCLNPFSSIN